MIFKRAYLYLIGAILVIFSGCAQCNSPICSQNSCVGNCKDDCYIKYQNCVDGCNDNKQCINSCKSSCDKEKPYVAIPQEKPDELIIQNNPIIPPSNIITISAVGMGVAPSSTISPAQSIALAKRAAMVDAYRQLGEKMYGIRINATDTIGDMVVKNTKVKTKVLAIIKNAQIIETNIKDGLCQVKMEVKLDGRVWNYIFSGVRGI